MKTTSTTTATATPSATNRPTPTTAPTTTRLLSFFSLSLLDYRSRECMSIFCSWPIYVWLLLYFCLCRGGHNFVAATAGMAAPVPSFGGSPFSMGTPGGSGGLCCFFFFFFFVIRMDSFILFPSLRFSFLTLRSYLSWLVSLLQYLFFSFSFSLITCHFRSNRCP